MAPADVAVVIPTSGGPEIGSLLDSLLASCGTDLPEVVVVDDRPDGAPRLELSASARSAQVTVVRAEGRGPAAASNAGWRTTRADWVVFLDESVVVQPQWYADLRHDLATVDRRVGGIQGRVLLPRAHGSRGSGAHVAPWMAGDMAFRRLALVCAGGLEERYPLVSGDEDAALARTLERMKWQLVRGRRCSVQSQP